MILKDVSDEKQTIAGYAKQKRLALREQFNLFKDESQAEILASSKARSIIDLSPIFDVFDAENKILGVLKKEFKKSLVSSSWSIYDPGEKKLLFTVSEKDRFIAVLRRLWNFIPIVGEVPFPLKFHFLIMSDGKIAGEYLKLTYVRDHYALYLKEGQSKKLDERVWMVMAVLLDAMQSR